MKNDIKAMLKEAANRQEINDIQDRILNCVDTSKVVKPIQMSKRRRFGYIGYAIAGFSMAALLITFGIVYGVNAGKGENPVDPGQSNVEPINEEPVTPKEDDKPETPVIQRDNIEIIKEEMGEELAKSYNSIIAQDSYNIINAAYTFDKSAFNDYSSDLSTLDVNLENSIVSDVNVYIHNIEDMFSLVEKPSCTLTKNTDSKFLYDYVINVESPYYSYDIYYNENLAYETGNLDNYKLKTELSGLLVCNDENYTFSGIRRIKNGRMEYETNVYISTSKLIEIKEVFSTKNYEFTYKYYNGVKLNTINIQQKFDSTTKATKEIDFTLQDTDLNKVVITFKPNEKYYVFGKIKSSNSNELRITKTDNEYSYKFKNSGNEYLESIN